jgi:hypothetical protein
MAHYDDYEGVWPTLQSLRAHHVLPDRLDVELLVVDNSPQTPHGKSVRDLCGKIGARYVEYGEAVGTSASRNRMFAEATGDVVVCMDCHVLIELGGVAAIRDWYAARPDSRDMLCGPLLDDAGGLQGTHFNAQWRAEMWGVWGSAWACRCDVLRVCPDDAAVEPLQFSPRELDGGRLDYVSLVEQTPVTACPRCGGELPAIGWDGHQAALLSSGYQPLESPGSPPFEVPGQGLGLFAMRRDAWVGFHSEARGFGGEELWVHAKVRAAGGRVLCHPAVRWTHRFGRPGGVPYPCGLWGKVRNYVLEFRELGWRLDPIRAHFVGLPGLLTDAEWDYLVADPVAHSEPQRPANACQTLFKIEISPRDATASVRPQPPPGTHTLDTLYDWCAAACELPAETIRQLAEGVRSVTAIVRRREWDLLLAAGRPDVLTTYTTETDGLHELLDRTIARTETKRQAVRRIKRYTRTVGADSGCLPAIDGTELLVLETTNEPGRLARELAQYAESVSTAIAVWVRSECPDGHGSADTLQELLGWLVANPAWRYDPGRGEWGQGHMLLRFEAEQEQKMGLMGRMGSMLP